MDRKSLLDLNYRDQPSLECCRNCVHARPADMKWSALLCELTCNKARVFGTSVCDSFDSNAPVYPGHNPYSADRYDPDETPIPRTWGQVRSGEIACAGDDDAGPAPGIEIVTYCAGHDLPAFAEMSQEDYRAELRRYGWELIEGDHWSRWSVNRVGCCGIDQVLGEDSEAFDCRALRHARKQLYIYRESHEVWDGDMAPDAMDEKEAE